ncbi:GtrA family protein [Erythrobacter sp. NFXS35]|uniref:GtrA family protein n=1 Tax=Erythrobacter sp. NFXS35 TaxID=2818436 RepID=UPI0032DF8FA8
MALLRQVASFGAVGICATLVHVALAWTLIERVMLDGLLANACGAAAAFSVSYLGNARITFRSGRGLSGRPVRYLAVTLVSLALSSAILSLVEHAGLPTYAYAVIVVLTVPPTTFLLAKFWAFRRPRQQA